MPRVPCFLDSGRICSLTTRHSIGSQSILLLHDGDDHADEVRCRASTLEEEEEVESFTRSFEFEQSKLSSKLPESRVLASRVRAKHRP